MAVIVGLFRNTSSFPLTLALADFERKILDLAKVYRWQGEVLHLELDFPQQLHQGSPFQLFPVGNSGQMASSFLQAPNNQRYLHWRFRWQLCLQVRRRVLQAETISTAKTEGNSRFSLLNWLHQKIVHTL